MIRKELKKIDDLRVSSYIEVNTKVNPVNIKIKDPTKNMQQDYADFEAISIMYKCLDDDVNVEIEFDELGKIEGTKSWNGMIGNLNSDVNTYLRFLYRLMNFKNAFCWVSVSKKNIKELGRFEKLYNRAIEENKVTNNYSCRESSYNEKKGEEHVLEKIFTQTKEGKEYMNKKYRTLYKDTTLKCVYDQLYNGLFNTENNTIPHESNRIFTSGAYDIWGIDSDNNFCIFELKKHKKNAHLGVISELFFYATFAKNILCNKKTLNSLGTRKPYRGYEKLYEFVESNKLNKIKAIFFFGENENSMYYAIENMYKNGRLMKVLNQNRFGIEFNLMTYKFEDVIKYKNKILK